jgi:cytochrome P450
VTTFAQQELAIILHGLLSPFTIRLRRDRPVRPRVITVAPEGGVELVLARRRPVSHR